MIERPCRSGDAVRIKYGPFADFIAEVEEVNEYAPILKVKVIVFGRSTSFELHFLDAENASFAELENWWNKGNRNN